jgi:(1->4)-alpha-D-glucan 1-alpha-D-glucosylmutase
VDFKHRISMLAAIQTGFESDRESLIGNMLSSMEDGRVKMFLIWRALSARRRLAGLFGGGEYLPLSPRGRCRENVVAFARRKGPLWAVTVVPRLLHSRVKDGELPLGQEFWADTRLTAMDGMPSIWRDAIAGEELVFESNCPVGAILQRFPVALLIGGDAGGGPNPHQEKVGRKSGIL